MKVERRLLLPGSIWLFGLALFILLFPINEFLVTDAAPYGISSHRAATSASEIDQIQASWQVRSMVGLAISNLMIDYVFIGAFSLGGFWLCREMARAIFGVFRKRLCWALAGFHLVFGMSDLVETTAQCVQLVTGYGSDMLIGVIHLIRPITIGAFLTSLIGVLIALPLMRRAA